MTCKCYHADKNFLGKIGVCWGTKECEACSCGGDESKCDFYEDKRKKATPKTTNADRIRAMTSEELAHGFAKYFSCEFCRFEKSWCACERTYSECVSGWLEWLLKEVTQ